MPTVPVTVRGGGIYHRSASPSSQASVLLTSVFWSVFALVPDSVPWRPQDADGTGHCPWGRDLPSQYIPFFSSKSVFLTNLPFYQILWRDQNHQCKMSTWGVERTVCLRIWKTGIIEWSVPLTADETRRVAPSFPPSSSPTTLPRRFRSFSRNAYFFETITSRIRNFLQAILPPTGRLKCYRFSSASFTVILKKFALLLDRSSVHRFYFGSSSL
jgi:hypothetical protein